MAQYEPRPAPVNQDREELRNWVEEELRRLSEVLEAVENVRLVETHVEPEKKTPGMVLYADGVDWNPGSGKGAYLWNGTAWQFLG